MNPHEPDPAFAAHLEWQLRTALRRHENFSEPVMSLTPKRLLLAATLVLFASGLGACGVLAAQTYQRNRAAELLGVEYQTRHQLADLRAKAAQEDIEELMLAVKEGVVSAEEFYAAEEQRIAVTHEAGLLAIDAVEVGYSGREPDRRLSAPLVHGHDYVTQRIELARADLRFRISATTERLKRVEGLQEAGGVASLEVDAVRWLLELLGREDDEAERKLELRTDFLRDNFDATRAELLGLREEAVTRIKRAELELRSAKAEEQRTSELAAAGAISSKERKVAQRRLAEATTRLKLAQLEIEVIDARLGEGEGTPELKHALWKLGYTR